MDPQQFQVMDLALQAQVAGLNNAVQGLQAIHHRRRRPRHVWVHPWIARRDDLGFYGQLMVELEFEDPAEYKNFVRMDPHFVRELHDMLSPRLERTRNNWRKPYSPGLMLALTLRYLACGSSYHDLNKGFRVPHKSISYLIREVYHAIIDEYADEMICIPDDEQGWQAIADLFGSRWNFHNTIGAMDGKHIAIQKPPHSGKAFFNYKKFTSIVLMAVVDAEYKFIWIDCGVNGNCSDAQIWNHSEIKQAFDEETLPLPPPKPLPRDNQPMKHFLIAEDAFALTQYVMKPFGKRGLTREERIYNYRLSHARRVVENAFDILVNHFRCLSKMLLQDVETCSLITHACCILHNIFRVRYQINHVHLINREDGDDNLIPGAWSQPSRYGASSRW